MSKINTGLNRLSAINYKLSTYEPFLRREEEMAESTLRVHRPKPKIRSRWSYKSLLTSLLAGGKGAVLFYLRKGRQSEKLESH